MISEVDIKDWEHKISAARVSAHSLEEDNGPDVCLDTLFDFIRDVENLVRVNQKQVAALFKEPAYKLETDPDKIQKSLEQYYKTGM